MENKMTKPFNWKLFLILWLAGVFGTIAVLPYVLTLQSETLKNIELPISLPVLITLQVIQSAVILGILTALGLLLANRIGLGAPIIEAWLNKESITEKIKSMLPISIILGLIAGVLIIVLDVYVFQPLLIKDFGEQINAMPENIKPPAWQGFLASFYGGIAEELQLRLFFMSLLAWIGSFIVKPVDGKANASVLWIANILAALAFGVGHLPAAAAIFPALTTLVVIRIILLNSIGGIIFGWLYQTRGIESAMIAHFSADIVLHVLFAI
jgi:hypothetical protein